MMLPPVAMPATPHLVDPPFGNVRAELRLMMDDTDRWEVPHLPACAAKAQAEVDLLEVDEEAFVEEADAIQRFAA